MRRASSRGSAAPDLCAGAAAAEQAVEEDRELELAREHVGDDERLGARRPAPRGVEVDDGDDVDRPDVRMQPAVGGEVDARDGLAGAGEQRGRQHARDAAASVKTARS